MTKEAKFILWIWFKLWAVVGKLVLKDQMDIKKAGPKVIVNIKKQNKNRFPLCSFTWAFYKKNHGSHTQEVTELTQLSVRIRD